MGSPTVSRVVVQNGAMLAVTPIEFADVTAAVLESEMAVMSTSSCGADVKEPLRIAIVAVFAAVVTWTVQAAGVAELVGHVEAGASRPLAMRNPADGFPELVDTVGFKDNVKVTPDGMFWKVN